MIPIYDSLAHPTLNGGWLGKDLNSSFAALIESMNKHNIKNACAVGLAGVEGYSHKEFLQMCTQYPQLYPVAGFDFSQKGSPASQVAELYQLGYRAIKIHPRFSKIDLQSKAFTETLIAAQNKTMTVFLCTYQHCALHSYPEVDPFYTLIHALKSAPKVKMVLVHGGATRILEYAELVRFNPTLLLDLSFTLSRYSESSVDQDIRFLCKNFDRRICIGSDFPEYNHQELRNRFEVFSAGLTREKCENIAFRNLQQFLS